MAEETKEKPKRRTTKVPMPQQDPKERVKNFNEVPHGYTLEMATEEAKRCIQCKKPTCVEGCPVNVNIPKFIKSIADGNLDQSAKDMKADNSLPAICGRVCPQETQCEELCILGKKQEPVAIGRLERFIADWERNKGVEAPTLPEKNGKRVAVIGAGPAGLTCAGDLAKMGYEVTIFEALHLAGGVLVYGIPEFRLPKAIVQAEVDYISALGVDIQKNMVIGKILDLKEIFAMGYDAIFLGTGAGLPMFMRIPGEELNGVYSANEYLTRINLMKAFRFPEWDTPIKVGKRVAVMGAGNVAMDAARCSLRIPGVESVKIIYRRSDKEMPARAEEVEHAKEEGVEFHLLTNPLRYIGEEGWVKKMELIKNELGEPDSSGRRSPVNIKGSEYIEDVDTVVVAIGNKPSPLVPMSTPELKTTRWGTLDCNEENGLTSIPGVYCGGDAATGAATVISAMGAGRRSAKAIDEYLKSK
jgi:glutamate synthase (NADPH) small chain